MSLLGRDVIALRGLLEHNLNQPTLTKFKRVHLGKMTWGPCPSISGGQLPLQASSERETIVDKSIRKQESSLCCEEISVENLTLWPNKVFNLVFNKYCKGHYFLNTLHFGKVGRTVTTEGLQFSLLKVHFYCPISWEWETERKHLLACKIELSKAGQFAKIEIVMRYKRDLTMC